MHVSFASRWKPPMTHTVLDRAPATTGWRLDSACAERALSWSAGLAVTAAACWILLATGVGAAELLRFTAFWFIAVIIPGVLVHRALRGTPPTLVEDLGLGAATGVSLELLAGVLLQPLGLDRFSVGWFVLPYAMLLVPALRRRVLTWSYDRRESAAQAWALAASSTLVLFALVDFFKRTPLPSQDSDINIDPWWHLSMTTEMLKPGLPQIPQVAGEPFVYHWFSHMHMAIAGASSQVDLPTVVFRLWIVPIALGTIAVVVALARHVSGVPWAGPLAVWLTFLAVEGGVLWSSGTIPARSIFFMSPSQTLTNLLVVAAAVGFVDAIRRDVRPLGILWLALLVFGCTGAKPPALTALLGGTILAVLVTTIVSRRVDRLLIGIVATLTFLLAVVMPMISGSLSGKMTLFASLESLPPYSTLGGGRELLATSKTFVLDTLDSPFAWLVGGLTLGRLVLGHATTFLGTMGLVHRTFRSDPVAWWLAGAYLSGWAAFLVVDHPSRSQFYFLSTTIVFGAVASAWFATLVLPRGGRSGRLVVTCLAIGAVVAWLARHVANWARGDRPVGPVDAVWEPAAVALLGLALVAVALWLLRARRGSRAPAVLAVLVFTVIGLTVPGAMERTRAHMRSAVEATQPREANRESIDFLPKEDQEAARWLRANSDPEDVVATNVHCRPGQEFFVYCDARAFWLSALSERRILLEGWGYTPEASAAWGVGNRPTAQQPSPWPDRLALSQDVLASPTPELIEELRTRGVRWVVGVRSASTVSDGLAELTPKVFDNEFVAIYRVDGVARG